MAVFRWACSENIVYLFVVGRVTCSDVIAFVELVCIEHMRGVFVRRLLNLRFVDLIVGVLGHQRKLNVGSSLDVRARAGVQRRSRI